MRTRFSHVRDVLKASKLARPLLNQAREDLEIDGAIRESLPAAISPHVVEGVVSGNTLTIFLDSPAWQTKARFFSDQILAALRTRGIKEAVFKTRPKLPAPPAQLNCDQRPRLSEQVVQHLYEAAAHQMDPRLSDAYRRLARRNARHKSTTEP
ncbi:DUF721 domain-containing protein [Thiorhodococcus mannitoliphagus]|uniref:DUF721 domain-containing protein n=1 Tax=Thiorhodococcus mannitoliphagus TaxID=329406 RepID=A0A6P1DMW1_9GAMM|nr:DUF721 domain-containing protein [Thiorhodococcus mannitoliphagus]